MTSSGPIINTGDPIPVWDGPYVTCTRCAQACVPTMQDGEWKMPEHSAGIGRARICLASLAVVHPPEHETARRQHEQQSIPEAKGLLDDDADPMKGPT